MCFNCILLRYNTNLKPSCYLNAPFHLAARQSWPKKLIIWKLKAFLKYVWISHVSRRILTSTSMSYDNERKPTWLKLIFKMPKKHGCGNEKWLQFIERGVQPEQNTFVDFAYIDAKYNINKILNVEEPFWRGKYRKWSKILGRLSIFVDFAGAFISRFTQISKVRRLWYFDKWSHKEQNHDLSKDKDNDRLWIDEILSHRWLAEEFSISSSVW